MPGYGLLFLDFFPGDGGSPGSVRYTGGRGFYRRISGWGRAIGFGQFGLPPTLNILPVDEDLRLFPSGSVIRDFRDTA